MPCSLDSTSWNPPQLKAVVVDHLLDESVAIVTGLDTVDLSIELLAKAADVGEVA
jgi:hypothetical protein